MMEELKLKLQIFLIILFKTATHTYGIPAAPAVDATLTTYTLNNCTKEHVLQIPNMPVITDLNVMYCNISELENAFFIRFHNLTSLEITDSKLTALEDYALHGLRQLKSLSLARNNITELKSWSMEQMNALISLDLRRNAISKLTLKSFYRYPNLQRLNLAVNLLTDIDDGIFRWMPHLKYLNLGRNHLKAIDARNFHGMHRLTHLSLHFNEIEDIEGDSFSSNTHLRSLRLEGNKLRNLDFMTVKNLVHLVHLNLSYNGIDSLESLTFSKDYELISLDMSYNRLIHISADTFAGLESLQILNISHNFIEDIEARSFHELTNLLHIDISGNNVTRLPADIFNGTKLLQHINLSRNALQEIDATLLATVPFLSTVDLSKNQLHTDAFIKNLATDLNRTALELNLSDNRFSMLNLSALTDFHRVGLAGNVWSCKWLIQELLRMPPTIHFDHSYSVATTWSTAMLNVSGIDCHDEMTQRNIIVLNAGCALDCRSSDSECGLNNKVIKPTPPALLWPRVRLDKFDSRSVIIWMLISIAIAFSILRVARRYLDRKERKKMLLKRKEMPQLRPEALALGESVRTFQPDLELETYDKEQRNMRQI
ncbi:insulin-like growth factor-binding protein complex acid labile subunit [Teleopsis dalmanni]|uniref:insulin-like growth factor-binding protein complex acid labile subunit n=1 Tax=Teleopsis dalmanni TaxID=139649 RepID=UPI0018CD9DBE|nr:insulin-like growth factor-binding protein complex acid labile subunit [Teleopsis dalmanni]